MRVIEPNSKSLLWGYVTTKTIGDGDRDYSSGAHNHKQGPTPSLQFPQLQLSTLTTVGNRD